MDKGVRAAIGVTAVAGVLILAPGSRPASAADFDCAGLLRMHGMLRRASVACGFTAYNPTIVDRARTCFDAIGGSRGTEEMHSGAAEFERWQAVRHRDALCQTLAAKFPMVVRPCPPRSGRFNSVAPHDHPRQMVIRVRPQTRTRLRRRLTLSAGFRSRVKAAVSALPYTTA